MRRDLSSNRKKHYTMDENKKTYQSLYNSTKNDILKFLYEKTLNPKEKERIRAREIALFLGRTIPDINEDIRELKRQDWIQKNRDENFELTAWGRIVYGSIEPFVEFMNKHRDYFLEHDVGNIPFHFMASLGAFEYCSQLSNPKEIIRKEVNIIKNSKKYVYNKLRDGRYDADILDALRDNAKNIKHFEIKTILDRDAIPPPQSILPKIKEIDEALKENGGKRELRRMKNVTVAISMNESEALVMFPRISDGKPDITNAFYGQGSKFLEWCQDYFLHCWEIATPS